MDSEARKKYNKQYYENNKRFKKERYSEALIEKQKEKAKNYVCVVTTRISGHLKSFFFGDLIKREAIEADHLRNILEIHYSILGEFPELKGKEPADIKYEIIRRMKS